MTDHHYGTVTCPKCGQRLPIDSFGSNKSTGNGKNCYCKACVRAISARRADYHKKWSAENRTHLNTESLRRDKANPEAKKARTKRSFEKHRAKNLKRKQAFYRANKHKWKTIWKGDPDTRRIIKHRRRAREAGVPHVPYTPALIFARTRGLCTYCGRPAEVIDHVIPIIKRGPDAPDNVTGACAACNGSKKDHDLGPWVRRRSISFARLAA